MLDAHVVRHRRDFTVDVTLRLEAGGCLALFGASGSGKSTVLSAIAGIERPDGGYIESFGLPAVMPLLAAFLAAALPLPWLVHLMAQRRSHA